MVCATIRWSHTVFFPERSTVGLCINIYTPKKLTANAPENRQFQKETRKSSKHPFSGAFAVSFREGNCTEMFKEVVGDLSLRARAYKDKAKG